MMKVMEEAPEALRTTVRPHMNVGQTARLPCSRSSLRIASLRYWRKMILMSQNSTMTILFLDERAAAAAAAAFCSTAAATPSTI